MKYIILLLALASAGCQTVKVQLVHDPSNVFDQTVMMIYFQSLNRIEPLSRAYFQKPLSIGNESARDQALKKITPLEIPVTPEVLSQLMEIRDKIYGLYKTERQNYQVFQIQANSAEGKKYYRYLEYKISGGELVIFNFYDSLEELEAFLKNQPDVRPEMIPSLVLKHHQTYDEEYYRLALRTYWHHFEELNHLLEKWGVHSLSLNSPEFLD